MTHETSVSQGCKKPGHGACSMWWARCTCGWEWEATSSLSARHYAARHEKETHR